jgi:hypothetical protein
VTGELWAGLERSHFMSYEIRPGRGDDEPTPHERPIYDEHVVISNQPFRPTPSFRPAASSRSTMPGGGLGPEIGPFHQGNELSQAVLRRYLLTRAIGASIVRTVYWFGVCVLVLAVLVWFAGIKWLAVLIGIAAVFLLLFRAMLSAIQRRISGIDEMGSVAGRMEQLVGQTRKGLRAELRRLGLPSAPWGPALIGLRLIRPVKRADTVRNLAGFDLTQVVPSATLDELHLLLRSAQRP